MTLPNRPRRGFWYQVWRPFRALGRGLARVLEFLDHISVVVNVGRGIVWLVRGAGCVVAQEPRNCNDPGTLDYTINF
ncbi:hypothetical protein [Isoptericola sp. NPDC057653]|uniref:hypothetical protein n=1 Tax=Isoptericola sp. NPDC057653 TaxID=3346195 RepID=UPI0036CEFDDB